MPSFAYFAVLELWHAHSATLCNSLPLLCESVPSFPSQPGFAAIPLPWSFPAPLSSCHLQFHCSPSCSFSFSASQPCTVLNILQSKDVWIIMIAPIFWQLTVGQYEQWALGPDCLFHPHQPVKQVLLLALFYRIENYSQGQHHKVQNWVTKATVSVLDMEYVYELELCMAKSNRKRKKKTSVF